MLAGSGRSIAEKADWEKATIARICCPLSPRPVWEGLSSPMSQMSLSEAFAKS